MDTLIGFPQLGDNVCDFLSCFPAHQTGYTLEENHWLPLGAKYFLLEQTPILGAN